MSRRKTGVAIALGSVAVFLLGCSIASATFTESDNIVTNAFTTATLAPPTGVGTATAGANGITVNWTHSTSDFEDGYNVLRSSTSGGPYTQIGTTGGTTSTYTDPVAAGTYYYVVQATGRGWTSANSSQASGTSTIANTGFLACTAHAAVTTGSGDNNGFQTSPLNACSNVATKASDANTGTGITDTCTGTTKDRHVFSNFGAAVAVGKTIDGIEIRAALTENNITGSTRVCAELSWNAGVSWTTAKPYLLNSTTEVTTTYGAPNDLWGRTWTVAETNNTNFRLRITNSATTTTKTISLRNLGLRITYH